MNPFSADLLRSLALTHGTPLWVYDAQTIHARIAQLSAFDTLRYAQKANSNIHLLRLMRQLGVKVDAVSLGEIERAMAAGFEVGDPASSGIVFTADLFDSATLHKVVSERIPVNAGSMDMLSQLGQLSPGHPVWLRINPGFGHGHSNKTNTGGEHSKHGIWHTDLPLALHVLRQYQLRLIGLHMHIGSGVDYTHLQEVCAAMVQLAQRVDVPFDAISAGGGLSIPYTQGEPTVDVGHYFGLWDAARSHIAKHLGRSVSLEIEPGRYVVAESGVLVAQVRATKRMGSKHFVLVDAGFNELIRPSLYGSHHEISVIPHDSAARPLQDTVVAGPLCESGDVFTQGEGGVVLTREMPQAHVGDWLVFHDAGAYGASMSSNYNSRPLAAEILVELGQPRVIRRRQSIDHMLSLELTT